MDPKTYCRWYRIAKRRGDLVKLEPNSRNFPALPFQEGDVLTGGDGSARIVTAVRNRWVRCSGPEGQIGDLWSYLGALRKGEGLESFVARIAKEYSKA